MESSLSSGTSGKNGSEFNKYKEGYRLYVTQEEPEREISTPASFYEEAGNSYP